MTFPTAFTREAIERFEHRHRIGRRLEFYADAHLSNSELAVSSSLNNETLGSIILSDNFRNTGFFNNTSTSILVPYDNPKISTLVTFRQSATDANNHLKTNLAATYAQDQMELFKYVQVAEQKTIIG